MPQQSASAQTGAILYVARGTDDDRDVLESLRGRGPLLTVHSIEEALAAMRTRDFGLIVSHPDDFLPLARLAGPLRADSVLESVGQGVCVIARNGDLLWANSKLKSFEPETIARIRDTCLEAGRELEPNHGDTPGQTAALTRSLRINRGHAFVIQVSAVRGVDARFDYLVALVLDVTASVQLQNKLSAIDAAGRELVRLDADAPPGADVGARLELLESKIISYMRDLLNYDHFIIRVLDKKSGRLDTVIAGGMSEEARALSVFSQEDGSGISGHVASTGRSYICPDVTRDPRYLPGITNAMSSLTVPLRLHEQVVGVLNIESDQRAAFGDEDRQVAEIFARYVAIALHILQLLVVERHATTGQLASDVATELAAPLNDIVTESTQLIEQHLEDESLRRRLRTIIENVQTVKRSLRAVTDASVVGGLIPEAPQLDPVIAGKRVLVADDEEIIRETVAEVLSKNGAVTVMARDGEQATMMLNHERFDLVLSDIKMPQRSGYEVFAAAKRADATCPVILITGFGYDPNHSIVRASKEGLAGVLYKPFKVDKLLEEVRRALTAKVG